MRCPQCLMENPEGTHRCKNCRTELRASAPGAPGPDPWAGQAVAAATPGMGDAIGDGAASNEGFDRSMFGDGSDLGGSGLELESGAQATPPGVPAVPPGQPPTGSPSFAPPGVAGPIPAETPAPFDTSSFATGPPVPQGPSPEAYQRFDEAYFAQNRSLLPDASTIHGSRHRGQQNADDFFAVDPSQNQNS